MRQESSFESPSTSKNVKTAPGAVSKSDTEMSMQKLDPDVQAVINAQILEQLDRIGKVWFRLKVKTVKRLQIRQILKNLRVENQNQRK